MVLDGVQGETNGQSVGLFDISLPPSVHWGARAILEVSGRIQRSNGSPTGTKRGAWLLLLLVVLLLLLLVMMMISRNLEEPSCVNNQFCSLVFFY